MDLVNSLAQVYAESFSSEEDGVLHTIHTQTLHTHPQSHMLSGRVQGRFLEIISRLIRPLRILEIGSFTGYSGICLARGLAPGGKLHTIELREEDAATAMKNFNMAGLSDKIILHTGNALTIIPALSETWDLVFIDADKVNYTAYYKLVVPFVRSGGLVMADNVLFHGEVLEETIKGKNAKAIQAFNEYVQQDNSMEKVLLTIRDGLLLLLKK
jgi:predicted O-methyltransferase YrrM